MARAATTSDVYNAIAEPRRREILELLGDAERAVNELVDEIDIGQSAVSKHLGVLREVDLVNVRRDGRRRLYSVNGEALAPVHDWVGRFERLWNRQLDTIRKRAEAKHDDSPPQKERP
jgi:DNA-binding transcriptional ArsR family regulator